MKQFKPEEVIVEAGSETSPIYGNLVRALPGVRFRQVEADALFSDRTVSADRFGAAKRKLYIAKHKGDFFKKCPGSEGQVCCNYFVINFASNCPMDCSYCYLQDYLANNAELRVFSNVDDLIAEADRTLNKHRGVFFRVGTGEITDSLALEPYTGMVRELIPYFAEQPNVMLELKTKSDCVDGLARLGLQRPGGGRLVDESAVSHRCRRVWHGNLERTTDRGATLPRRGLPARLSL